MDFKDWKKIKEDGKTCMLSHPKGHTMTIALRSLPKIQREQIKRLKMASGGEVAHYDEGTADGPIDQSDSQPKVGNHTPITINVGTPAAAQAAAPAPAPIPVPQRSVASAPIARPPSIENEASKTLGAIGQQQSAIQQQSEVDAAKAKEAIPAVEENIQAGQGAALDYAKALKDVDQHVNDFRDYINQNPIDPKHYQENMGSGAKVATAVGLIVGGMGVPFGGHNYAYEFLNKQIDRDIEAQKSRTENQRTILGAYQDLYGKNNVSIGLAKASMDQIYARKIELAALKQGTPQAIINAKKETAKLYLDSAQQRQNAAAILSGGGGGGGGGAPQGPAKGPTKGENHPFRETILSPDADARMKGINYQLDAKGMGADYQPLMNEYTQAKNADAALGTINNSFMEMKKIADEGGADLRAALTGKHAIAGLAGAAGSLVGHGVGAATMAESAMSGISTDKMRRYESAKSNLLTALSSGTRGTNLGSGDLNDLVEKYAPVYGDEPKTAAEKLLNLRKAIIEHVNRGYLIKHGLSKPRKEN